MPTRTSPWTSPGRSRLTEPRRRPRRASRSSPGQPTRRSTPRRRGPRCDRVDHGAGRGALHAADRSTVRRVDNRVDNPDIRFGLEGRVCLITGAAQGIGAACARRFAREGAIVVVADVDDERGAAVAAEVGGRFLHCDVGEGREIAADGRGRHGRVRAHRRAGQQRRDRAGRRPAGGDGGGLRRRPAGQPPRGVPDGAGGRPAHGRRGSGQHREPQLGQRHLHDPDDRQLQHQQGRHEPAHEGVRPGSGRQGRARERGGPGDDRHRDGGRLGPRR